MARDVQIEPSSGTVHIADVGALSPWQDKASVEALLRPFANGHRDHRNGYEWLYFETFSFGDRPCGLSLCFFHGRLERVDWSLSSGRTNDGDWPTRQMIDEEVKTVSAVLDKQLGHNWRDEKFAWGQVWSCFDEKGFLTSNGLRYKR